MADDALTDLAAPPKKRRLRKRMMHVDRDTIAAHVLDTVREVQDGRAGWITQRLLRHAKLRGWTERADGPWDGAADTHMPVMMANSLRVKAGLNNAALGIRPMMTPKVMHRAHVEAAETANQLIDYQVFVESEGEKRIDAYIADFVDEGTAISHQAWSKDTRKIFDVRVFPTPTGPLAEAMVDLFPVIFGDLTIESMTAKTPDGDEWDLVVRDTDGEPLDVAASVYDVDERKIEVVLDWERVVFDGPTITVHDLEDVGAPVGAENPQPVSADNPFGAPFFFRLVRVPIDYIRRRQKNGTYHLLTDEDLDGLAGDAIARRDDDAGNTEQSLKQERDERAGVRDDLTEDPNWITVVEWYGAYDIDGDGLEEEVVFTVLKEPELLARARYLSEVCPGLPPQRPVSHACFIPVRGELYGIGLPELMEGLHDLLHVLFNMNLDNGTITNRPFFFYRPSSGLKPDVIDLWPGDGYPLDNPQSDVYFPQMPHQDQSWNFNMIGLAMQFVDRLTQIGPMQMGQVPTGKASALRTLGTTLAILQQGAALPEQILRRLFAGLAQIWHQIHRMNARHLPKNKRFLIAGRSANQDDAYGQVADPNTIAIPIAWDFQATLLNTNKGLVAQALTGLGAAIINPLTMQMGLVDAERIYNWAKDLIQANQLDPTRYLIKPKGAPAGPRLMAEEAIALILEGKLPEAAPAEADPNEHLQKLMKFMQGPDYAMIVATGVEALFKNYLALIVEAVRQSVMAQQQAQAAGEFAAAMGNQGQGAQAVPGAAPEMQTEAPAQDELMGAMNSGG